MNAFLARSARSLPYFLCYLLLLGLVLFVSLFFPSSRGELPHRFELGERWRYEDMEAPFSFALQKNETRLHEERQQIRRDFVPYYQLDSQVQTALADSLRQRFAQQYPNSGLKTNGSKLLDQGLQALEDFYRRPYLQTDSLAEWPNLGYVQLSNQSNRLLNLRDCTQEEEVNQRLVDKLKALDKLSPAESHFLFGLLREVLQPNLFYNREQSETQLQGLLEELPRQYGLIKEGDKIVRRNALIDSLTYEKLSSLQFQYEFQKGLNANPLLIYLGYLTLTLLLIGTYSMFLHFYTPELFENPRHLAMPLSLIGLYSYLAYVVHQVPEIEQYIIPFCIIPLILQNFYSAQLALFTHIVVILLVSLLLSLDYQFILIQIEVGMVAIITKLKTRYLSDFFTAILYIAVAYFLGFISLELIHSGAFFSEYNDQGEPLSQGVRWTNLGWVGFSICLTLLSYPLIPLLERIFGLTSEITLVELSDLNNPLLKELSIKAPCTLQHSLQVANLAEAVANEVHANALLLKVAALYHDIGKMKNPQFFIENQTHFNPHDKLLPLQSAQIIIGHVEEGVEMARKHRLPKILKDFIRTHHGTTRVEYFYRRHVQDLAAEGLPEPKDDSDFRYPGPKPRNREEAILMMADSLEAASKSLKNPSGQDIDQLVENIIRGKIANGQFEDTDLSFHDLDIAKKVFKKMLRNIHHVRIEYPKEEGKASS